MKRRLSRAGNDRNDEIMMKSEGFYKIIQL